MANGGRVAGLLIAGGWPAHSNAYQIYLSKKDLGADAVRSNTLEKILGEDESELP